MARPLLNDASIRLDIPIELRDWIDAQAAARGISRADYIRSYLLRLLQDEDKTPLIDRGFDLIETHGLLTAKAFFLANFS